MSLILAMLAAGALTRATPANYPGAWVTDADYPAGAKKRREEGRVGFSLLVSSDGKVQRCSITASSGFPELDHMTCVALTVRAKFKPARDENGIPALGAYTGALMWRHPDKGWSGAPQKFPEPEPDFIISVLKLPDDQTEEIVSIVTRVDEAGKIAYCEAGKTNKATQKLVQIACGQVRAQFRSDIMDDAGKPIAMIRSFRVAFRAQSQ